MRRFLMFSVTAMLLLAGCGSAEVVRQKYYYPPKYARNSALDSLAEAFQGLLVEELDVFFEKWSEISSGIASSREPCELDSIVRFVWDYYPELKSKRMSDTSRFITISEKILVHYYNGPLQHTELVDFYLNPRKVSFVGDTLIRGYTPILVGEQKPVLYYRMSIFWLLYYFLDGSKEKADILRSYIPVDFMMDARNFVNTTPDIYSIHFFDNGVMAYSQLCGTYEEGLFFPSDGSPATVKCGLLQ